MTASSPIRPLGLALLLLLPALPQTAHALSYFGTYSSTLWDTPSQYFTDADWKLFDDTLQKTLDTAPDGEANAWSNPASKASGDFTVLKSVKRNGQDCREVKIVATAGGYRRITGIAFCKEDDGSWKAVPGRNHK